MSLSNAENVIPTKEAASEDAIVNIALRQGMPVKIATSYPAESF